MAEPGSPSSALLAGLEQGGELAVLDRFPGPAQPLFAVSHPNGQVVYVADAAEAAIVVFDARDGRSYRIASGGLGPCHLAIAPDARLLVCANYSSAEIATFQIDARGDVVQPLHVIDVPPAPGTAVRPRPHHVEFLTTSAGVAVVAALGRDHLLRYDVGADGQFRRTGMRAGEVPGRRGPRSLAQDREGNLWCTEESSSTVSKVVFDGDGFSRRVHTWKASLNASSVPNYPGYVLASSNGRFIYAANRGRDTIRVFATDSSHSGPIQEVDSGGRWPSALVEHCGILYVANRDSGAVSALRISPTDGRLGGAQMAVAISRPSALALMLEPDSAEA